MVVIFWIIHETASESKCESGQTTLSLSPVVGKSVYKITTGSSLPDTSRYDGIQPTWRAGGTNPVREKGQSRCSQFKSLDAREETKTSIYLTGPPGTPLQCSDTEAGVKVNRGAPWEAGVGRLHMKHRLYGELCQVGGT